MKLTAELIESAAQYINPATKDRELDLRSYKIQTIENMGATLDQFDCVDFSDNDIRKLDGFPLQHRLKKLLLNNNRIARFGDLLEESLPNLNCLILTNNNISELGDIDTLATVSKLECVCLLNNPVTTKKHYRPYVIHKLPQVRLLDFRKVKQKEREEATLLFKGTKGKQFEKEIGVKSHTFVPGGDLMPSGGVAPASHFHRPVHTPADVEAIKAAISKAQTLEEVERLNQLLKAGYVPGRFDYSPQTRRQTGEEMDEENCVQNGQ